MSSEFMKIIVTVFLSLLGLGMIMLGLNLPYYFIQYQLLVCIGGLVLVFFGMWLTITSR